MTCLYCSVTKLVCHQLFARHNVDSCPLNSSDPEGAWFDDKFVSLTYMLTVFQIFSNLLFSFFPLPFGVMFMN